MENLTNMDDLGVPPFQETSMWNVCIPSNSHLLIEYGYAFIEIVKSQSPH